MRQQQRIGPENPGLSRFLAARLMLVVVASFYVAGLFFVVLYAFGVDPLASHPLRDLGLEWPFSWSLGWPFD